MHGYAGNPALFPDAVSLVDDADLNPATAAALDVAGQNLADRTAYLNANRAGVIVENWQPWFLFPNNRTADCKPSFDGIHGRWIFGDNDGGTAIGIRAYPGLPNAINSHGLPGTQVTLTGRITCVRKDPTDAKTYYMAAIATSGSIGHVYRFDLTTGVYTGILTTGAACTDVQLACFNGRLVVAVAGGASSGISYSTNQGTSFSGSGGSPVLDCDTTWTLVQNDTQLVAVANHLISTNEPGVMLSTDGSTFTTESFGAAFAAGDNGIGTAWGRDITGFCWIFCHKPAASSGTTRKFLRSSDGITWTDVGTTLTTTPIQDLVAIQNAFLGIMIDAPSVDGTRLVYSLDGAVSWQLTQFNLNSFFPNSLRLGAAPAQFCATFLDNPGTETTVLFSNIAGSNGVPST